MLIDARSLPPEQVLDADVCIVGAGAAGIAIARELIDTDLRIVVVESGGLVADGPTQELYRGAAQGPILGDDNDYLLSTRQRFLGGSTNHWEGWCRPLDFIDFRARPWVEGSGWPFDRTVLEPHYERAAAIVEIPSFQRPGTDYLDRGELIVPEDGVVETRFFHLSPPTRFGQVYRAELERAAAVRVVLNASATEIVTDPEVQKAERVELRTLAGKRLAVTARAVVLAAGGIENARLLLASRRAASGGLGNDHDLVGRYFMDHPIQHYGHVRLPRRWRAMSLYQVHDQAKLAPGSSRPPRVVGILRLADQVQERERLLNALVVLERPQKYQLRRIPHLEAVGQVAESIDAVVRGVGLESPKAPYHGLMTIVVEPIPSVASRVTLGPDVDAVGVPRARLDWQDRRARAAWRRARPPTGVR